MQRWRIRKQALESCASLIQVNMEAGDGDLYVGLEDWEAHDVANFARECERISGLLARKAEHIGKSVGRSG